MFLAYIWKVRKNTDAEVGLAGSANAYSGEFPTTVLSMRLFSLFERKTRDKPPKPRTRAEIEARYQKWFHNCTVTFSNLRHLITFPLGDIRALFFDDIAHGWSGNGGLLEAGEAQYFDSQVQQLSLSEDHQISIRSILDHLKQAHAAKAPVVEAAGPILETLITSHAHFPFADPVLLTRNTLLQAIILLTRRCRQYLLQEVSLGDDLVIRVRSERQRLRFMYSALAHPPAGLPTRHDIVDVVCRVKYPMDFDHSPKVEPRKYVRELEPLAERLKPDGDVEVQGRIPVADLQPLVELVAAFPLRWA
ncbi:hypothetical protein N0V90_000612 [Kalmusia sp. IMI 367209]|nr:hypothetical protein N0V90_000612 [Kalmusia sp. IMI 367209]